VVQLEIHGRLRRADRRVPMTDEQRHVSRADTSRLEGGGCRLYLYASYDGHFDDITAVEGRVVRGHGDLKDASNIPGIFQ
jgi:hypothetical protein